MLVNGQAYRTVWMMDSDSDSSSGVPVVRIIDQRLLPWEFRVMDLGTVAAVAHAISDMAVRGAGCIGATAGYGMALAAALGEDLEAAGAQLKGTRPTAVNLAWAVDRQFEVLRTTDAAQQAVVARETAEAIADEDAAACQAIGEHGLALIREIAATKRPGEPVNVLTHCNAGWLAFVDHGSATAPIYAAHDAGLPVHVWVDETRPRNQGARLTAWELHQHGVPHTVIADNAGGHLMQQGQVDLVITGTDRTTRTGDVANKIGTYLKALAARDNSLPFYVALPSSTVDWKTRDGVGKGGIPIEERSSDELIWMDGLTRTGEKTEIRLVSEGSGAANPAFDVTPARLVTGLITERGICAASEDGLRGLFPGK